MFAKISPQQRSQRGGRSVQSYVNYLEKENEGKSPEQRELFFNQQSDDIHPLTVVEEIETNMGRIQSKTAPTYYTMTISPSQFELAHIGNSSEALKAYTRSVMKDYASTFHQEIHGRPIKVDDIKYFAKIEYRRYFTGKDALARENAPFLKRIDALNKEIKLIQAGEFEGNVKSLKSEVKYLKASAPQKINDHIIKPGMEKTGLQTHVHLILSRRDASNSIGLSPGGSHLRTEMILWGKPIKHGFDDNLFKHKVEKTFDRMFNYNRNFVESYEAMKTLKKDPTKYYRQLYALPPKEKSAALSIQKQAHVPLPPNLSFNQISLLLKQIKKGIDKGLESSSIGY